MGNGLYKLTTSGDCSETKYESVLDINLLNYQRQLETLGNLRGKKILFLTLASENSRVLDFMERVKIGKDLLNQNQIEVVGLITNTNSKENKTFMQQQTFYQSLGIRTFPCVNLKTYVNDQIEIEGQYTHPILKFLKRKSQLYDYDYLAASELKSDLHMFLTNEEGTRSFYFKPSEPIESVVSQKDSCFEYLEKKIDAMLNKF